MAQFYDVVLVRHGESEANAVGRFACTTWDPHLTEVGRSQAERLAAQFHSAPIHHLVTSPLARARETIQPLADALHIDPVVLPDLAEVNLGLWDGARLRDLEQSQDAGFQAWRRDPEANPPPGGESILTVGRRVISCLEDFVTRTEPGLTMAATHADCIKGAVLVVTKSPGPAARRLFVPNGGQLMLRYFVSARRWTLVLAPLQFPSTSSS